MENQISLQPDIFALATRRVNNLANHHFPILTSTGSVFKGSASFRQSSNSHRIKVLLFHPINPIQILLDRDRQPASLRWRTVLGILGSRIIFSIDKSILMFSKRVVNPEAPPSLRINLLVTSIIEYPA
jgi:hypothetical protein